ncbi:MAG: formate dehydrogenase subunit alpha [Sulfolobaceae archaeon]|nr:formate dehydrogenase subunit alpha [Sulfolobaceae archaeon]
MGNTLNVNLTVCPFCSVGCSFYVVKNDGSYEIIPARGSPVNEGKLCIKGWHALDFVLSKDRLLKPLIRRGNSFIEASWNEALDIVANKLREIRDKYGPDSIGFISSAKATNEDNYIFQKFARVIFGTNNVDHCARLCHSSTVEGLIRAFGTGAMTFSISDIDNADLIFIVGSNTTEHHPIIGSKIINAVKKGANLIVIDPKLTKIASLATIHLQNLPGTDIPILNAIANILIKENYVDWEFINHRTEGFDEFRKIIEKYTPEYASKISEVPEKQIIEAAELYGKSKRTIFFYAMGVTQHIQGTETVEAIANLAMLKGNVGRESTGVGPLRGQNNVQGASDMGALSDFLPGYVRVWDSNAKERIEKIWNAKIPEKPGLTVTEMFEAALEGRLKAMYIIGENPVVSDPHPELVRKALENLEFLVVQDLFLTETAKYADVILPAKSFAEKKGTFTSTERRIQKVHPVVNIEGPLEDWKIITLLARRLGYDWNYEDSDDILREINLVVPQYAGATPERLEEHPFGLQWPVTRDGKETKILHKDRFTRGLGKFHAVEWNGYVETRDSQYPFVLTTGGIYYHWCSGVMTIRSHILYREAPEAYVEINVEDAKLLNIKNGQYVKVKTKYGEVKVKAMISEDIKRGVLFIPFHYSNVPVNELIGYHKDPISRIPEYKVVAARIEVI